MKRASPFRQREAFRALLVLPSKPDSLSEMAVLRSSGLLTKSITTTGQSVQGYPKYPKGLNPLSVHGSVSVNSAAIRSVQMLGRILLFSAWRPPYLTVPALRAAQFTHRQRLLDTRMNAICATTIWCYSLKLGEASPVCTVSDIYLANSPAVFQKSNSL